MSGLEGRRVLLDARWLRMGGAGRATELVLRGLRELEPPGEWIVWGPRAVAELWRGTELVLSESSPKDFGGQRALASVPQNDIAIYLHNIRPLRPGRSVTLLHDTIPLRHGGSRATRASKRLYLRAVAALSTRIVTVSRHSRTTIERDLRVDGSAISVVTYPVDRELAARVEALRAELPASDTALYVGSFSPHKNLDRLVTAFKHTRHHERGGALHLTGGDPARVHELSGLARRLGVNAVVEGPCPQSRLEELYATSRLLVLPSLEEGFGLPVWEAVACGLPVCVSTGGSLPEITAGLVPSFSPTSIPEMSEAIDEAAEGGQDHVAERLTATAPALSEFAEHFVRAAEQAAG